MKKALLFVGLAAATLSFVGCNKEADVPGLDGRKVEIVLTDAQTRTVNDDMTTKWAENDELSVFYAPAGSTDWSSNTKFTVTNAASNVATGEVELTGSSYDWYLFYPYVKQLPNPSTLNPEGSQYERSGYTPVGSKNNATQTQNGLNSTAHLSGANLPVWGVAKNVAADKVPTVSMKHVTSVVKVNVTNGLKDAITISSLSFTGTEDIVGTYYIDITGDAPTFVGSGDGYVSSTANLTVSNADALASGATASFYIAVKPFTAPANGELAIKVVSDAGSMEKTVKLDKETSFQAGHIKTLNVTFASAEELPTLTLADIKDLVKGATSSSNAVSFEGKLAGAIVTFASGKYAFIQDETAGLVFYNNTNPFVAGQKLEGVVSGSGYTFNGLKEVTSFAVETITPGQTVPAPVELTLAELNADYDRYESVRVTVKNATVSSAFSNRNTTMTDGDESLTLRDQKNGLTITPGVYDITGYPSYYNAAQFGVWTQDDIVPVASDQNFFGVSQKTFNVPATATSVEVNVTGNVDWTAVPGDNVTVDPASGNGEGTVTVSFPANTDSENAKDYSVHFMTEATGVEDDDIEVIITQEKAFAGVTIEWDSYADWDGITVKDDGSLSSEDVITLSYGDYLVTIKKNSGSTAPTVNKTANDARAYAKATITVKNTKSINMETLIFNVSTAGLKRLAPITASVGTIGTQALGDETVNWTGEATEVTFTVGDKADYGTDGSTKAGQLCFDSINVVEGGQGVVVTLSSIAVSGQKTTFTVGDTFTFDGTVTATYSDGSTKEVTPTNVSTPDMSTAGTKEVTVTYTENGVTETAKYNITVNAASEHDGSLEKPYSVAEALAAAEALGEGKTSDEKFYIKGKVSTVPESVSNGRATYMISDGGTSTSQMKVYNGYYIGNASFETADQLKSGDEVIVYGKLQYFKPSSGDSELEISASYIYELKRGGAVQSALSAKAASTTVSANASTVKVNVYGNVDWTAAVTSPATIDMSSGSGQGVINVSIPENTDTSNDRTFTVTISATGFDPIALQINQQKKQAGNVIIIDGASLTSTLTTAETELSFSGVTVVLSSGAKFQSSTGDNRFADKAILIGKNGAYIYNKTAIPGKITKFEIYANKGASAKVSVGVNFSASAISTYDAEAANTYTATLSTLDSVYDCTDKLPADAKYFWYQVTNANNSQVQFRITYE